MLPLGEHIDVPFNEAKLLDKLEELSNEAILQLDPSIPDILAREDRT